MYFDMYLAYASIYLIPAAFFLLGIWMILRVLTELGVGKVGRRICFVVLATLLLAPSVAGAIVVVAWVPNGLFLLAGEAPMIHQPRLVAFAAWSFSTTAAVSAAVAWLCIREPGRSTRTSGGLARIGGPLLAIGLLLGFYYTWLPDREIFDYIDWALIESEFGEVMDSLLATLEMDDLNVARAERERLHTLFESDPIYWGVQFADDRFDQGFANEFFQREVSSLGSCSGQPGNHHRLMHCTRDTGRFFDQHTLKFTRDSVSRDGHRIEIEFEFELFLARYPGPEDYSRDVATLQRQDRQLLGSWHLERQSNRGGGGPRNEIVSLNIGPRLDDGIYELDAKAKMVALNGSRQSNCTEPQDRCKWFGTSSGTLRIRGSRVQILYEARGWFSDRLQLTSAGLVGIDPWGDAVHFQRIE